MSGKPRKDCPECNTPDVIGEPVFAGEVLHECPNCERSFSSFDPGYMVVDKDDSSSEGESARESNRKRGFLW